MKMKHLLISCGMAVALVASICTVNAQQGGGGGFGNGGGGGGGGFGGGGGGGGFGGGGGGGGRGGRGGGGGFGGNMDPAAMQQRMLDNIQQALDFTNDTDWSAVEPLVQKVIETRTAVIVPNLQRLLFGGGGRGGGGGRRGGGMQAATTTSPEADALQKALDDEAPSGQVKDLLTKYQNAQKTKIAKAKEAEEALRMVLTPRQEATATLMGLLETP